MARPSARVNLLFVPSPDRVVDLIKQRIAIPEGAKALDPCCGAGRALSRMVGGFCQTFGVELEVDRAAAAKSLLTNVLYGATQDARISNRGMGLILLNPPYDDSVDGRLEMEFLRRATEWLCPGGIMVFIIKEKEYLNAKLRHHLLKFYDRWEHWRFPMPEYEDYGQTVMICRRAVIAREVKENELPWQNLDFGVDHEGEPAWKVPVTGDVGTFFSSKLDPETLQKLMGQSPLWRLVGGVAPELPTQRPLLPLKSGHLSLMLASGAINGVYGGSGGIPLHVARGLVKRIVFKKVEVYRDDSGEDVAKHITTDAFCVVVRAMDETGNIHEVAEAGKAAGSQGKPIVEHLDEEAEEETLVLD